MSAEPRESPCPLPPAGEVAEFSRPEGARPAPVPAAAGIPARRGGPPRRRLRRALTGLNPVRLLFNPVMQKEMRVAGRRRWTYALRFIYAVLLLALTALVFWAKMAAMTHLSAAGRLQQLQDIAPSLSYFIVGFQFLALALAAPILTAGAVSDERRKRTLAALATTPLTAPQIVAGKLLSGVFLLIVLSLIPLPLLMGVRLFGGLEAGVIVGTFSVNLSLAILGAALGVWFSTRTKRSSSAILFAMLIVACSQIGPILSYGLLSRFRAGPPEPWIIATCSPMVLFAVCDPRAAGAMGTQVTTLWLGACAYNLGLAFLATLGATAMLRRVIRADAGEQGPLLRPPKRRHAPAASAASSLPPPDAPPGAPAGPAQGHWSWPPPVPEAPPTEPGPPGETRPRRSRSVGDRPVLWRELRQSAFGGRWKLIVTTIAVGALLALIYTRGAFHDAELHAVIDVICILALMLQAALTTTGGVAGEREARSLPILLTTPLPPREILWGKYAGTLRKLWFVPTLLAAHLAVGILGGVVSPVLPLALLFIISGPVLLLSASGLLCSVLFKRSTTAAIVNFAFAMGFYAGPWLLAATVGGLLGIFDHLGPVLNVPFAFNPVAMAVTAAEGLKDATWPEPRFRDFDFPRGHPSPTAFAAVAGAVWAGYAAGAAGAVLLGARFLRRAGARE